LTVFGPCLGGPTYLSIPATRELHAEVVKKATKQEESDKMANKDEETIRNENRNDIKEGKRSAEIKVPHESTLNGDHRDGYVKVSGKGLDGEYQMHGRDQTDAYTTNRQFTMVESMCQEGVGENGIIIYRCIQVFYYL
jgi:hypothetical protein